MSAARGLWEAISFLTVIPLARKAARPGPWMLSWLPAVGGLIGALWTGFDLLAGMLFPPALRCWMDVLFLVGITGGLHLDGLADTADGLLSHRGREEALRIMRDSRIGTWGVLALVWVLLLKGLALNEISGPARLLALLLIPAYGRLAMLVALHLLPYGRGQEGIAHSMVTNSRGIHWVWWVGILVAGSVGLGWPEALLFNVAFGLVMLAGLCLYSYRMGCITGDMAGALGEVTETGLLLSLTLRW